MVKNPLRTEEAMAVTFLHTPLNQSQTFGYPHCNGREKAHIQKVQPGLDYESTARGVHKFQYPRQQEYCTGNECAKPAESVV